MSNLISFLRDAWALVLHRRTMSREEYEAAKEEVIERHTRIGSGEEG